MGKFYRQSSSMTASLTKLSQQVLIHLFTTSNSSVRHTAISRKVVGKNVHATIPKSNYGIRSSLFLTLMTLVVEPTFVAFLLTVGNICRWPPTCHYFKLLWRTVNSKPPTIPFGIVACTFSNNLSQNSCRKKLQNVYGPFRSCVGNWGEFQI